MLSLLSLIWLLLLLLVPINSWEYIFFHLYMTLKLFSDWPCWTGIALGRSQRTQHASAGNNPALKYGFLTDWPALMSRAGGTPHVITQLRQDTNLWWRLPLCGGLFHNCISVLSCMSGFHGSRELSGRQALASIFKGKRSSFSEAEGDIQCSIQWWVNFF